MKVFLSWSGERSRQVAELLDDWLQCVIQAVDPWMSSKDIDRGALWFSEITDQLANTGIGVVCLTKENKNKPWILFESGALAKGISSNRVCTLLIDLKPTEVENPLAQFNHSIPNKTGVWELVRTINLTLKEKALKESILEKVFDTYWSQFDKKFKEIIKNTPEGDVPETRSENDIMLEVLSSIRSMDRRMRKVENDDNLRLNEGRYDNKIINHMTVGDIKRRIYKFIDDGMPIQVVKEVIQQEHSLPLSVLDEVMRDIDMNYNKVKRTTRGNKA